MIWKRKKGEVGKEKEERKKGEGGKKILLIS